MWGRVANLWLKLTRLSPRLYLEVGVRRGRVEEGLRQGRRFESAIARGADGVELDVHPTRDGELVVHHFYGLGTTDDGEGLVCEHTLAELKALDSGSWFDERFNLVDDVELTTAHYPLLPHMKKRNPGLRTGAFFYKPPEWMPLRLAQQHILDWATLLEIWTVHLNIALITVDFVDLLHRRGFAVHGSNLDSEEEMRRKLNSGVDSFSTGCLGMALQVRDEFLTSELSGGKFGVKE
jgi:glycerophosphoryl diester phosphodiesterase